MTSIQPEEGRTQCDVVGQEEMLAMASERVRRSFGMSIEEYIEERRSGRIDGCDSRAAALDVFLGWQSQPGLYGGNE